MIGSQHFFDFFGGLV